MVQHLSAQEIIQFISDAKKSTPLKIYINGDFSNISFPDSLFSVKQMIGSLSMSNINLV